MAERVPRRRLISDVVFDNDENVRITSDAVPSGALAVDLYRYGFHQYSVVSFRVSRLFGRRVDNRPCVIKPNDRRRVWVALGGDLANLKSSRLNKKQNSPHWIISFHLRQPIFVETISRFAEIRIQIRYNTTHNHVVDWLTLRMNQIPCHLNHRREITPNWH